MQVAGTRQFTAVVGAAIFNCEPVQCQALTPQGAGRTLVVAVIVTQLQAQGVNRTEQCLGQLACFDEAGLLVDQVVDNDLVAETDVLAQAFQQCADFVILTGLGRQRCTEPLPGVQEVSQCFDTGSDRHGLAVHDAQLLTGDAGRPLQVEVGQVFQPLAHLARFNADRWTGPVLGRNGELQFLHVPLASCNGLTASISVA